jgi:hypothetical protein
VVPSVRGRERFEVGARLVVASGVTGALAGWLGGVAWSALLGPALNGWALVALVLGCLALDAVRAVAPFSVLRQVPQLWGRIFSPRVVAVLYGARLGVGPLTILRTWLWWAAFLAGASAGAWWSAGVGAAFGVARVVAMLMVGTRAGGLLRWERRVSLGLGAAVVGAVAVTGAFVDAGVPRARAATTTTSAPELEAIPGAGEQALPPVRPSAAPVDAELAARLPDVLLAGWTRAADDPARRLGPLDLAAAAAAEADTPAERALLETRHFRRGHARGWRGPDGQVGYASVYEFATSADAAAYLVDGTTTIEARGARVYDVTSPAGGKGFSQAGQAAAGAASTVSHGVVFVEGARFFLVFVSGNDSSVDPTVAAQAVASVVAGA